MTGRTDDVNIDTSDIDALLTGVGRRNHTDTADQSPIDGKTVERQSGKTAAKRSKFTVLLDEDDALAFDMLAYEMRAAAGRRVEKSEILRTLIGLASEDFLVKGALKQALARRIAQKPQES
ncbi:hypothetical protein [Streptomyces sp. NRRL F-2664]|uniref:hypothetical protein n=1 Tax=Streptomyces sp. NRRL F-2664 TaxID=1463842 RepID=UPI0004C729A3|nr:hypothetical protein [Streptomyces sp. NRRL F-2664]